MEIRRATLDDAPAIRRLLQSLSGVWQESWRPDAVEHAIEAAAGLALVAVREHSVVGFVCSHDVGFRACFRAYLSELVVSESEQRSGLGRQLLRQIETELAERGCSVLVADVYPPAEPFYRKLGWTPPAATLLRRHVG